MDLQLKYLISIYSVVFFMILITIIIRNIKQDALCILQIDIFEKCDSWCVSHFIVYILLVYFAPKFWYISFVGSILWEYIEYELESYPKFYLKSKGIDDIKTNTFGIVIGMIANSIVNFYRQKDDKYIKVIS